MQMIVSEPEFMCTHRKYFTNEIRTTYNYTTKLLISTVKLKKKGIYCHK